MGKVAKMESGGAQFTPVCTCEIVMRTGETLDSSLGDRPCSDVSRIVLCQFHTAAPAMYEALKALHSVLDQRMPDGRTLNQHLSREVFECFYGPAIAARAAIAKAEGA